jgi:hypothetical protein
MLVLMPLLLTLLASSPALSADPERRRALRSGGMMGSSQSAGCEISNEFTCAVKDNVFGEPSPIDCKHLYDIEPTDAKCSLDSGAYLREVCWTSVVCNLGNKDVKIYEYDALVLGDPDSPYALTADDLPDKGLILPGCCVELGSFCADQDLCACTSEYECLEAASCARGIVRSYDYADHKGTTFDGAITAVTDGFPIDGGYYEANPDLCCEDYADEKFALAKCTDTGRCIVQLDTQCKTTQNSVFGPAGTDCNKLTHNPTTCNPSTPPTLIVVEFTNEICNTGSVSMQVTDATFETPDGGVIATGLDLVIQPGKCETFTVDDTAFDPCPCSAGQTAYEANFNVLAETEDGKACAGANCYVIPLGNCPAGCELGTGLGCSIDFFGGQNGAFEFSIPCTEADSVERQLQIAAYCGDPNQAPLPQKIEYFSEVCNEGRLPINLVTWVAESSIITSPTSSEFYEFVPPEFTAAPNECYVVGVTDEVDICSFQLDDGPQCRSFSTFVEADPLFFANCDATAVLQDYCINPPPPLTDAGCTIDLKTVSCVLSSDLTTDCANIVAKVENNNCVQEDYITIFYESCNIGEKAAQLNFLESELCERDTQPIPGACFDLQITSDWRPDSKLPLGQCSTTFVKQNLDICYGDGNKRFFAEAAVGAFPEDGAVDPCFAESFYEFRLKPPPVAPPARNQPLVTNMNKVCDGSAGVFDGIKEACKFSISKLKVRSCEQATAFIKDRSLKAWKSYSIDELLAFDAEQSGSDCVESWGEVEEAVIIGKIAANCGVFC